MTGSRGAIASGSLNEALFTFVLTGKLRISSAGKVNGKVWITPCPLCVSQRCSGRGRTFAKVQLRNNYFGRIVANGTAGSHTVAVSFVRSRENTRQHSG